MELSTARGKTRTNENWLSGHQRPWIFERILLLADDATARDVSERFADHFYTLEHVQTPAEALRRVMQTDFEAILCRASPQLPVQMFCHGVERVKPYAARRLVFLVDAMTDPRVAAFIRKQKMGILWYPAEAYVMFETLTAVIRRTTSLSPVDLANRVTVVR